MNVRFFDPGREYLAHKDEMDATMQRVLAAGDLILRKDVDEFEETFAKYIGVKHVISCASGTDALSLCLAAGKVDEKDIILCPSYTFRATVETALRTKGTIELYDPGDTLDFKNIDVWMPAYIAGEVPATQEADIRRAQQEGTYVIEDTCQAVGAAPVMGNAACYSFYPAKILGCYGDGGAIATNNDQDAEWFRKARNHFKGDWLEPGYNSRLDNLQAAVLNVKMKYLPSDIARRKEIAEMYDVGLLVKHAPPRAVYQDYIIEHRAVPFLMDMLKKEGVETMANGYPFPSSLEKGLRTTIFEEHSLRIPCNPGLTNEEVEHVIKSINKYAI